MSATRIFTSTHTCSKSNWNAASWKATPVHEQPILYEDSDKLEEICRRISLLPPLIKPNEIDDARQRCAAAARGQSFMLLGGDCAENFDEVTEDVIDSKCTLLQDQAQILETALCMPVQLFGRIAGQYAKPRSQLMETLPEGQKVNAFRGCNVNGASCEDRSPDPERLLQGYLYANVSASQVAKHPETSWRPIATAHEALHLPFETAMTDGQYCTSATMLWLGKRTQELNGAHLEYIRGLRNPIGIKIGPTSSPQEVLTLLDRIQKSHCTDCESNYRPQVVLISRMGADNVSKALPPIVSALRERQVDIWSSGTLERPAFPDVTWMCDPCHGNTISVGGGVKTRRVDTMLDEITETIKILAAAGTRLGGLHLEQTGEEDINECIGYLPGEDEASVIAGANSKGTYRSLCDPRLSGSQARLLVRRTAETLLKYRQQPLRGFVDIQLPN